MSKRWILLMIFFILSHRLDLWTKRAASWLLFNDWWGNCCRPSGESRVYAGVGPIPTKHSSPVFSQREFSTVTSVCYFRAVYCTNCVFSLFAVSLGSFLLGWYDWYIRGVVREELAAIAKSVFSVVSPDTVGQYTVCMRAQPSTLVSSMDEKFEVVVILLGGKLCILLSAYYGASRGEACPNEVWCCVCGTAEDWLEHETAGTQTRRNFIIGTSPSVQWDEDEVAVKSRNVSLLKAAFGSVALVVDGGSEVVGNGTVKIEEMESVRADAVASSPLLLHLQPSMLLVYQVHQTASTITWFTAIHFCSCLIPVLDFIRSFEF